MAPMAPLGKEAAIKLVTSGKLPVWMGSPHPHVMILEQDGKFRIRGLVVDPDEERAAREKSLASGRGWMPEQHYGLGKPTGKTFVEAATRDALLAEMKEMAWPADW